MPGNSWRPRIVGGTDFAEKNPQPENPCVEVIDRSKVVVVSSQAMALHMNTIPDNCGVTFEFGPIQTFSTGRRMVRGQYVEEIHDGRVWMKFWVERD